MKFIHQVNIYADIQIKCNFNISKMTVFSSIFTAYAKLVKLESKQWPAKKVDISDSGIFQHLCNTIIFTVKQSFKILSSTHSPTQVFSKFYNVEE